MLARVVPAVLAGLVVFGGTTGLTASLAVGPVGDAAAGTTTRTSCDTDGVSVVVAAHPLLPLRLGTVTVTGIASPACDGRWVYVAVNGTEVQLGALHTTGTSHGLGAPDLLSGSMPLMTALTDIDVVISEVAAG